MKTFAELESLCPSIRSLIKFLRSHLVRFTLGTSILTLSLLLTFGFFKTKQITPPITTSELDSTVAEQSSETTPGFHPIFAPGTPPEVIEEFLRRFPEHRNRPGGGGNNFTFNDGSRWTTTATNGGGLTQGDPTILTWGFVPDGTFVAGFNGEAGTPSNLIARLDGIYGVGPGGPDLTQRPWFPLFQQIFNNWGALTGATYVYEPNDDGAAFNFPFPLAPGVLGVRADVRISGHNIDGNFNVLAYNFFPNGGDMVIDTNDSFYNNTSGNSIRLRNTLAHEHGHGLGIAHVCPINQTKLMEPFLTTAFDGPQPDDILAANRGYGDNFEPNDTSGTAHSLGILPDGTTPVAGTISLDDNSDLDFFSFTITQPKRLSLIINPLGSTYLSGPQNPNGTCSPGASFNSLAQNDLAVAVLDTNGSTVLASADNNGLGGNETLNDVDLLAPGTYFVRVNGPQNLAQLYSMNLTIDAIPGPEITKTIDDDRPRLNQIINYTITVNNPGPSIAGDGVISDTIPAGLSLVPGSVTLNPPGAGTTGPPPLLASSVTINTGQIVTLDFAATVNVSDTVIVNTAEVSASNALASDQVAVTVGHQPCPALGADGFGYTCFDSIDPGGPTFAFEDISATGSTVLNNTDDGEVNVTLPFNFTYYDVTSTDLTLAMNGAIIFGQTGQNIDFGNQSLAGAPTYMIAPFWDDLSDLPGNPGAIYTEMRGVAPNRRFIIQWEEVQHCCSFGQVTFQLILFETSNEILFQYQDVDFDNPGFDDGLSATVGIRGNSNPNTLQYSFNQSLIKDGLAIRFFPASILTLTKTVDDDQPRMDQTINYTVIVENTGPGIAANGIISDTSPAGLSLVPGSVTLNPPGAGTTGLPPLLVTDLIVFGGQTISLTFAATVNVSDTVIVNTAEVSASNAPAEASDQVAVTVGRQPCPLLGVDGFGYTCLDSIDPGGPTFAFEDISATGSTVLNNNDEGETDVTLPFPFTFYDVTSANLTLGMNGAAIFGQTGQNISPINRALNDGLTPNYMIAPFWDDLDDFPGNIPTDSRVYAETRGTQPNRRFIVQWDDIPHKENIDGGTFQLILFEGSNEILFQYQDVDYGDANFDDGTEASVGIRGNGITDALPYAHNEVLIKSGLAIRFIPPFIAPDLIITKTAFPTTVEPGDPITYTVTFNNQGTGVATGVVITDQLPATLTNINVVSSGVAITDTGGIPFTWEIQGLQPDQGGTITITAQIDPALTTGGLFTNTAIISTTSVESDTLNNEAEIGVTVGVPDLILTKSVDVANPVPGEEIRYTITVENVGTVDAIGAVVSDTLPLSLTLAGPVTLDPPTAGTPGTPPLLATNLTITAGQNITLTFPVTVSATVSPSTVITNTAAVTSLVVTTPQTDSVTIAVGPAPPGVDVYLPLIVKDFQ